MHGHPLLNKSAGTRVSSTRPTGGRRAPRTIRVRAGWQRGSWRRGNEPIHVGLGVKDQESAEQRLSLGQRRDVLEADGTAEARETAARNVVDEARRSLDAHARKRTAVQDDLAGCAA